MDLLLSIFPFEKAWYAARVPRLRVEFVGHPLVDRYSNAEHGMRNAESGAQGVRKASADDSNSLLGERLLPPHPSPLPLGEGITPPTDGQSVPARPIELRQTILPLPKGEGRGEGEAAAVLPAAYPLSPKPTETNLALPPAHRLTGSARLIC